MKKILIIIYFFGQINSTFSQVAFNYLPFNNNFRVEFMLNPFKIQPNSSIQQIESIAWYKDVPFNSSNGTLKHKWLYSYQNQINSFLPSNYFKNIYYLYTYNPDITDHNFGTNYKEVTVNYLNNLNFPDSVFVIKIDTVLSTTDTIGYNILYYDSVQNKITEHVLVNDSNGYYVKHKYIFEYDSIYLKRSYFSFLNLNGVFDTFDVHMYKYDDKKRILESGMYTKSLTPFNVFYYYYADSSSLIDSVSIYNVMNNAGYEYWKYTWNYPYFNISYKFFDPPYLTENKSIGKLNSFNSVDSISKYTKSNKLIYIDVSKYDVYHFPKDLYRIYFDTLTNSVLSESDSLIYNYKYTYPTSISNKINEGLYIELFPNPCRDKFYLTFNANWDKRLRYNIVDINSKIVLSKQLNTHKGKNLEIVDISTLHEGVYLFILDGFSPQKFLKK